VEGAAGSGALEQQVLEEVRRAVGLRMLVPRTHRDPESHRDAARTRHLLAEDPDARGQHTAPDERVSGCAERQLSQIERECYGTVTHRDRAYVMPRTAPSA